MVSEGPSSPVAQASAAPPESPSPLPGTGSAPRTLRGLHVLYPLRGGGYGYLLLTAGAFYRAVTPEEERRLTELLRPPVTRVDPGVLPPESPVSVTDALNQLTG